MCASSGSRRARHLALGLRLHVLLPLSLVAPVLCVPAVPMLAEPGFPTQVQDIRALLFEPGRSSRPAVPMIGVHGHASISSWPDHLLIQEARRSWLFQSTTSVLGLAGVSDAPVGASSLFN